MKSWRWYIRGLRSYYFNFIFRLGGFLFIGDTCPKCGRRLVYNNFGCGLCDTYICLHCYGHGDVTCVWDYKTLKELNGFEKDAYENKQDKLRKEYEKICKRNGVKK